MGNVDIIDSGLVLTLWLTLSVSEEFVLGDSYRVVGPGTIPLAGDFQ